MKSRSIASCGDAAGAWGTSGNPPRITRFGDLVDVRSRGAIQLRRFAGSEAPLQHAPAVVRVWHAEHCREMTPHEARAFAAQLLAAAALAESQNGH